VTGGDGDLRNLLSTLDPKARDDLRRVLIRDLLGCRRRSPEMARPPYARVMGNVEGIRAAITIATIVG
jgi:hypothetical protein